MPSAYSVALAKALTLPKRYYSLKPEGMNTVKIGLAIGLGLPFLFLYLRKSNYFPSTIIFSITIPLFITGLIVGIINDDYQYHFFAWSLCTPLSVYCVDRILKKIALKKYNRDFVLWLRGSFEINDSIGGKNPHVKGFDVLFSMVLLFLIFGLMATGAILFQK